MVKEASTAYNDCHFVLTSRPKAYQGTTRLSGFENVNVAPLTDKSIDTFFNHWYAALFPNAPERASTHYRELKRAVDLRPEIYRMATNPVMLTALAVVHWNAKRIPEQRADLYESIITWLSRDRESRSGRALPEECADHLQTVALAMQDDPEGRQTQWSRRKAAECIFNSSSRNSFQDLTETENFLKEEELDSGIIVSRGDDLRFWHLSFQEFLAARAIASKIESEQRSVLLDDRKKLLSSEWRETVLLLSGILHRQGTQKIDAMIDTIIHDPNSSTILTAKAQTVGLIGAIERDLRPTGYKIESEAYQKIVQEIMEIFDPEISDNFEISIRLEVADALSHTFDSKLEEDPWVVIEAGEFLMGLQGDSPENPGFDAGALAWESPVRTVRLEEYLISRFPVTVGEFEKFITDNGYTQPEYWPLGGFDRWKRPLRWENQTRFPINPVVGVSWYEAAAYCAWKGFGTTSQRERAARGIEGRRYPRGDKKPTPDRLNYKKSELGRVTPIGFYPKGASPEKIFDLSGNIFEWCFDIFNLNESTKKSGELHSATSLRTIRGGSFNTVSHFVRAGFRGRFPAEQRNDTIGFRLCKTNSD